MRNNYNYLLVGAGISNAIFAREATKEGKKCLVIDKRGHMGGNLYCENKEGINVHKYGPHVFHTNDRQIWNYMNEICEFNHFIYMPLARYQDKLYNLPFNMYTYYQFWGTITPAEAMEKINKQKLSHTDCGDLESYALSQVGDDIYYKLIKGYTEKQWGMEANKLPSFIIKRLPLRFTFNNNYFNDAFQGVPKGGYNPIFETCFKECDVLLNTDFFRYPDLKDQAEKIIFTGMIDEFYQYCYGPLEYRSLKFEEETLHIDNFQGNAAVNYTSKEIPFTRIIEHKHFEFGTQEKTIITREYPYPWNKGSEPYYPVNTEENNKKYKKYKELASKEKKVIFSGRLGSYTYYDMWQVVRESLELYKKISQLF